MNGLHALLHLAYADVLERTRRYSFLMMTAATLYLAYAIGHGDLVLRLGSWVGTMTSAWIGGMVATTAIIMLSLFGFYLVKNTIERDTLTGVGQIIAATPVTKSIYLLGKWLSNLAVLSVLLAILACTAIVLQAVAPGPEGLRVVVVLEPFVLLGIPALSCVAALALIFELIPGLRGGGGNVLYFFVWSGMITAAFLIGNMWIDWTGVTILYRSMGESVRAVDPSYDGSFNLSAGGGDPGALHTFIWQGITWTGARLVSRVLWLILPALGVMASGAFFHRFDPSRGRSPERRAWRPHRDVATAEGEERPIPGREAATPHGLVTGAATRSPYPMIRHVSMEVLVSLKGWPWWWYAGALVCIIGGLASPVDEARRYWLPFAWLWPVVLWSGIGTRDIRHLTEPLLFSSSGAMGRQVTALAVTGVVVAVLTGSGVMMNLIVHGDGEGMKAWCAGAMFIPSLALAMGLWTRSAKLFEILYLLLWYLGPLHPRDLPALDFVGATNASVHAGMPVVFVLLAVLLCLLAYAARWYRLRA
jgi:hypothetical protein